MINENRTVLNRLTIRDHVAEFLSCDKMSMSFPRRNGIIVLLSFVIKKLGLYVFMQFADFLNLCFQSI